MYPNPLIQTRSFLKTCRQFIKRLKRFKPIVRHLVIGTSSKTKQHFKNIMGHKHVFFIGERHLYNSTTQTYLNEMMRMFKTFHKAKKGPLRVHCFVELVPDKTKSSISRRYHKQCVIKYVYKNKQKLSRIRLHRIDIRFIKRTPLSVLKEIQKELLSPTATTVTTVQRLLKKVEHLFNPKNIKTVHSLIYKQFKKNKCLELLYPLFWYYFAGYDNQLKQFQKHFKKHKYKKVCAHPFLCWHTFLNIHSYFMDLYTIGRLMNPKYKYCVFLGGCAHTRSIFQAMDALNLLKTSGEEYNTCPDFEHPFPLDGHT